MSNHKQKVGNQTPTQSVIAPYQKTLSDEAVKFYERTGLSCYEWQKNLLDPIMAAMKMACGFIKSSVMLFLDVTVKPRLFT